MTREVVRVQIEGLTPFPKQEEFFPETPEVELEELAADMEANGQREPIIVSTDGVIICGHRRVAAAKLLGWTHIDAIVRDDLTADDGAAEVLFVSDNFSRRQLSPLQEVRCAARLCELGRSVMRRPGESLVDWVGRRLGMGGRNAHRYLNVLNAPEIAQRAFDEGHLNLTLTARVGTADSDTKQRIQDELEECDLSCARGIVNRHLGSRPHSGHSIRTALSKVLRVLRECLPVLDGEIESLNTHGDLNTALLNQAIRLFKELRDYEIRVAPDYED